jgi:hypothetical protein
MKTLPLLSALCVLLLAALAGCPDSFNLDRDAYFATQEAISNPSLKGRVLVEGSTMTLTDDVVLKPGAAGFSSKLTLPKGATLVLPAGKSLTADVGCTFVMAEGSKMIVDGGDFVVKDIGGRIQGDIVVKNGGTYDDQAEGGFPDAQSTGSVTWEAGSFALSGTVTLPGPTDYPVTIIGPATPAFAPTPLPTPFITLDTGTLTLQHLGGGRIEYRINGEATINAGLDSSTTLILNEESKVFVGKNGKVTLGEGTYNYLTSVKLELRAGKSEEVQIYGEEGAEVEISAGVSIDLTPASTYSGSDSPRMPGISFSGGSHPAPGSAESHTWTGGRWN